MRSFSASTSVASSQAPVVSGDTDYRFLRWLKKIPPESPVLRKLSDEEIWETFTSESHLLLAEPKGPEDPDEISSSEISVGKFNQLARCQLAQMSEDGLHLAVPNDHWTIKGYERDSIFIRQAYQDHWDIIYDHFMVQKSRQRVIISGTAGCGKSIEGLFLLHKIFTTFSDNPPPIIYAHSETSKHALVYLRGFVFSITDYQQFENTLSHKIMDANGPIWHVYDSTVPGNYDGSQEVGPQIIITSPGRLESEDMKPLKKGGRLLLYLPLPNLNEMDLMRTAYHNDRDKYETYISKTCMVKLITKWGCVPRTIFEIGNDKIQLEANEAKINSARDVERLIHMVGSSQIDRDVASGSFLHLVPIPVTGIEDDEAKDLNEPAESLSVSQYLDKGKHKAIETGLSEAERILHLKSLYTKAVYVWASDHIRDRAFEAFLTLGKNRMIPLVVNYQQATLDSFRGLLLEPFVFKLLTETGVVGHMKNLDNGKSMGSVKLGPWKTKNLYQNHSQLRDAKGVINIPLKGGEAAVDYLVPFDGCCFQIAVSGKQGINRPGLDTLIKTGVFNNFVGLQSQQRKDISFVFVVEAGRFDDFKRQDYHGENKKAYAQSSPLRCAYAGVTQLAFEIDLRCIYTYEEHQKKQKVVNMTSRKASAKLEKAAQKARTY
jgi:hypothetical protein